MNPEKVLVVGGAGFIGTNFSLSALARGCRVVVFDNLSRTGARDNLRQLEEAGGERLQSLLGDVADQAAVDALFDRHGDAEVIVHLAGQVAVTTSVAEPRADFEANLIGTFNLLEAMRYRQSPAALLYASTNKVYGELKGAAVETGDDGWRFRDHAHGIDETQPLDFLSPYGCSKGAADQYVLDYARIYGLRTVALRQSCVYGPYQFGIEDQGWVAWFVIAALLSLPITLYGDGKQVRDVLYVDDLIDLYWSVVKHADRAAGQAYNVGGGIHRMSLLQLIAILEGLLDRKIPVGFADPRPGDQKVFFCDTGKARRDLGWEARVTAADGVARLLAWARENKDRIAAVVSR